MQYDVIMITESWLCSSTPSSLLDPHNEYTVLRCDRQSLSPCGGVFVYVSKKYNVVSTDLSEFSQELEICCFDLLRGDVHWWHHSRQSCRLC